MPLKKKGLFLQRALFSNGKINCRCTVIHGTPTMYVDLVQKQEERQEDLSSAEIAVCGGSICVPHLFKKMLSVLNVKKVKVRLMVL